jgi:hypothetical protein
MFGIDRTEELGTQDELDGEKHGLIQKDSVNLESHQLEVPKKAMFDNSRKVDEL